MTYLDKTESCITLYIPKTKILTRSRTKLKQNPLNGKSICTLSIHNNIVHRRRTHFIKCVAASYYIDHGKHHVFFLELWRETNPKTSTCSMSWAGIKGSRRTCIQRYPNVSPCWSKKLLTPSTSLTVWFDTPNHFVDIH